tara:strand:- start:108 stop:323 length:216 start_codon:yes stop_codon:yes gene_type:complete
MGIFKYVAKIIITNPKLGMEAGKLLHNAYKKVKPVIDKKASIVKNTIKETPPFDDPVKFKNKLKENFKSSK